MMHPAARQCPVLFSVHPFPLHTPTTQEVDGSLCSHNAADEPIPNAAPDIDGTPSAESGSEDLEPCENYQIITDALIHLAEEKGAQDVAVVILYVPLPNGRKCSA